MEIVCLGAKHPYTQFESAPEQELKDALLARFPQCIMCRKHAKRFEKLHISDYEKERESYSTMTYHDSIQ